MSILAPALGYLWKSAEEFGLDPVALFEEAGIDPKLRLDINARVSENQMDDLIWLAKQKSRDEAFMFHLARNLHPSYMGALGFAWLTSSTLRKAFQRLERYTALIADRVSVTSEEADGELRVYLESSFTECHDPALRERGRLVIPVQMCRMSYGESFCPSRIHFKHEAPSNVNVYYEYFRCELLFGADASTIVLSTDVADEPLPGYNPQIVQHFDQMIVEYLARKNRNDIVGGARALILEQLPSGEATLESIADALNMSPRTLTRKLHDKDVSFKSLVADIRRELSEKYIMDKSLTLTEISFLLGFSEASSFSRAYKSWAGKSPSLHRSEMFG